MVTTLYFHCRGYRFNPWSGTKIPHVAQLNKSKSNNRQKVWCFLLCHIVSALSKYITKLLLVRKQKFLFFLVKGGICVNVYRSYIFVITDFNWWQITNQWALVTLVLMRPFLEIHPHGSSIAFLFLNRKVNEESYYINWQTTTRPLPNPSFKFTFVQIPKSLGIVFLHKSCAGLRSFHTPCLSYLASCFNMLMDTHCNNICFKFILSQISTGNKEHTEMTHVTMICYNNIH